MRTTKFNVKTIVMVGLFSAFVFISNYMSLSIPIGTGVTRIHFGNVFCILSGLLLSPIAGGLSAGIGSFLFDLTNPLYISAAPFTFLFKFTMAWVCARYLRQSNAPRVYFLAATMGSASYLILHLSKEFFQNLLLGQPVHTALTLLLQGGMVSGLNAVIAVCISVPLALILKKQITWLKH